MVNGFIFCSVCMCFFVCLCRQYVSICVYMCAHSNLSTPPPYICLSPPRLLLSVDMIYYTHTSASATGQDHKSKASEKLAAKKTQGCFSPTKRAINSVSQGVTHLSGCLQGKHASHNPPAIQSQF